MTGVRWFDVLDASLVTPHERLMRLVVAANAALQALSPEEQAAHWAEQRRCWAAGELQLSHPDWSRERCLAVVDDALARMEAR